MVFSWIQNDSDFCQITFFFAFVQIIKQRLLDKGTIFCYQRAKFYQDLSSFLYIDCRILPDEAFLQLNYSCVSFHFINLYYLQIYIFRIESWKEKNEIKIRRIVSWKEKIKTKIHNRLIIKCWNITFVCWIDSLFL